MSDDAEFRDALNAGIDSLLRLQLALVENQDRPPSEWAAETDYPYLVAFDLAEVEDFLRELGEYLIDAAQRGTLENLEGNLRAWESTAALYREEKGAER